MEDALGKILNDPGAMAQIMSLAQSLGLGGAPAAGQDPPPRPPEGQPPPGPGAPGGELVAQLLRAASAAGKQNHAALFRALAPYLAPHRQEKLERAMQIARLSRIAGAALQQTDPRL